MVGSDAAGTGVSHPATSAASAPPTSPRRPSSVRFIPTSTTAAPGLIQSPRTISGRPTAATSTSAWRQRAGRSRVREWATVTVALWAVRNRAMGFPTIRLRPTTTASRALQGHPGPVEQAHDAAGVQGTEPGSPRTSRPTLTGEKPSTSLSGWMRPAISGAR